MDVQVGTDRVSVASHGGKPKWSVIVILLFLRGGVPPGHLIRPSLLGSKGTGAVTPISENTARATERIASVAFGVKKRFTARNAERVVWNHMVPKGP